MKVNLWSFLNIQCLYCFSLPCFSRSGRRRRRRTYGSDRTREKRQSSSSSSSRQGKKYSPLTSLLCENGQTGRRLKQAGDSSPNSTPSTYVPITTRLFLFLSTKATSLSFFRDISFGPAFLHRQADIFETPARLPEFRDIRTYGHACIVRMVESNTIRIKC